MTEFWQIAATVVALIIVAAIAWGLDKIKKM